MIYRACEIEADKEGRRIIRGCAYSRPDAGDGWVVPPDVMRRAMEAWSKWGNVREMHQPKAIGTATRVEWVGDQAWLEVDIVDDEVWEKIEKGVYRGLSIGLVPLRMSGRRVTKARLAEVSVVDQPADEDATITHVLTRSIRALGEIEDDDDLAGAITVIARMITAAPGEDQEPDSAGPQVQQQDPPQPEAPRDEAAAAAISQSQPAPQAQPVTEPSPAVGDEAVKLIAELKREIEQVREIVSRPQSAAKPLLHPEATAAKPAVELPADADSDTRMRYAAWLLSTGGK